MRRTDTQDEIRSDPVAFVRPGHLPFGPWNPTTPSWQRDRSTVKSGRSSTPSECAMAGMTPSRQRRISYRKSRERPSHASPTEPSFTTPREGSLLPHTGPNSMAKESRSTWTNSAEWKRGSRARCWCHAKSDSYARPLPRTNRPPTPAPNGSQMRTTLAAPQCPLAMRAFYQNFPYGACCAVQGRRTATGKPIYLVCSCASPGRLDLFCRGACSGCTPNDHCAGDKVDHLQDVKAANGRHLSRYPEDHEARRRGPCPRRLGPARRAVVVTPRTPRRSPQRNPRNSVPAEYMRFADSPAEA